MILRSRNGSFPDRNRHLELSATLRRDIFDPETVRSFAEKVETPERLKMLCLLTYADIKAVNPDALTPWKAENIWQLYIALPTTCIDRGRAAARRRADEVLAHLRTLAPAAGKKTRNFSRRIAAALFARTRRVTSSLRWRWPVDWAEDPVQLALDARPPLVRTDAGHPRPPIPVCEDGRHLWPRGA